MDNYTIDFLELVKDKTTFLYEDNDNDKENKHSEELENKIAESVENDFELWNKIDETINYWYQNKEFLEVK